MTDTMSVAYRDVDRTPLLYVLRDTGRRYEDIDIRLVQIQPSADYQRAFLTGEVDLICENFRLLPKARHAGHPVRCIASCQNVAAEKWLASPAIGGLSDLAGRRVAIRATPSSRITAERWLRYLGYSGRITAHVVDDSEVGRWRQWSEVVRGRADAAIISPLYVADAIAAGLRVIDVPPLPQIGPLFLAALGPTVDERADAMRKVMRALYRALEMFRHDPAGTMSIMAAEPARLLGLAGEREIRRWYGVLRGEYDERPVPSAEAIAETSKSQRDEDPGLAGLNAMSLWDLREAIRLEESNFPEQLREARREESTVGGAA
jgi:ABC-type nitrate/sulfonate/bicarbonate transport system substrate-binding protein